MTVLGQQQHSHRGGGLRRRLRRRTTAEIRPPLSLEPRAASAPRNSGVCQSFLVTPTQILPFLTVLGSFPLIFQSIICKIPNVGQFRFSVRVGSGILPSYLQNSPPFDNFAFRSTPGPDRSFSALRKSFGLIVGPIPSFSALLIIFSVRGRNLGSDQRLGHIFAITQCIHSRFCLFLWHNFAYFPFHERSKPFSGGGEWIASERGREGVSE